MDSHGPIRKAAAWTGRLLAAFVGAGVWGAVATYLGAPDAVIVIGALMIGLAAMSTGSRNE